VVKLSFFVFVFPPLWRTVEEGHVVFARRERESDPNKLSRVPEHGRKKERERELGTPNRDKKKAVFR